MILTGLTGLALFVATPAQSQDSGDAATRARMRGLVDSLRVLLPLTRNDSEFGSDAAKPAVSAALKELAAKANDLEAHASDRDASFAFLSRTLGLDAREAELRYDRGDIRTARFIVQESMQTCVTCHSRLPGERESRLGEVLIEGVDLSEFDWLERAQLQTATRRYDDALASYEEGFASPGGAVADLAFGGAFEGYLELCIRAESNPARAQATLEKFLARDDVPDHMRARATVWVESLQVMQTSPPTGDALARADFWLERADARVDHGDDLPALVDYLAASAELHRFVETHPGPGPEASRAYYGLGKIESRIGMTAWISQAEALLEASILSDPQSASAKQAYAMLEEVVTAGYTGSSGEHVPPGWTRRLGELRALLDEPASPES